MTYYMMNPITVISRTVRVNWRLIKGKDTSIIVLTVVVLCTGTVAGNAQIVDTKLILTKMIMTLPLKANTNINYCNMKGKLLWLAFFM